MANYPLQYKTQIAIQWPTLVEPVRAPNQVGVHVGNVGGRDGVKNNTKFLQFLNTQYYK